jgi:hypothetical protein
MASIGQMYITVDFNTRDLSVPLKMIAVPAKIYIWFKNLYRKMIGKKMITLKFTIEETEA